MLGLGVVKWIRHKLTSRSSSTEGQPSAWATRFCPCLHISPPTRSRRLAGHLYYISRVLLQEFQLIFLSEVISRLPQLCNQGKDLPKAQNESHPDFACLSKMALVRGGPQLPLLLCLSLGFSHTLRASHTWTHQNAWFRSCFLECSSFFFMSHKSCGSPEK